MTIIFSSITYALKAERVLGGFGVYTSLTRSPAVTAVRGCGYGLRLHDSATSSYALGLLGQYGVPTLGTVEE